METSPVEKIKQGEFVRRIINGVPSKKTYQRGEYCRETRRYNLRDCDDYYGNGVNVKKGTLLQIGFDY